MSYNELITLIDACINRNGVQAITGRVLNGVLKAMVNQLGAGYALGGVAHPADDPGTPEAPVCYFASEVGTYTNFGGVTIAAGELALLCYDLTDGWFKETMYDGFQVVNASVDNNVGTPDVNVTYNNGVMSFAFENLKGNTGDAAGFGNISASVDDQIGTPSVAVTESGPNTAKNLAFAFHNLKGETGVTSVVVTVDNTTGTPQCAVSLSGQQLTLAFTGLKGAQGDTGSSVDYPFTIVNNLTTNDATQALSAAMGVQLESEVSQLEAEVHTLSGKYYGAFETASGLPEGDAVGYAFVGTTEPFILYNFDGEDWINTEAEIYGLVGPEGPQGGQGIQGIQGPPGVTSAVATVDNNTGIPSVEVALVGQVLTFTFHNLKGLQGNTGSSVDYAFTLVNNLDDGGVDKGLTAEMGKYIGQILSYLSGKAQQFSIVEAGNGDFCISDDAGYVLVKFENGHIKTKNFDSSNIDLSVAVENYDDSDFGVADENGYVTLQVKNGNIRTSKFASAPYEGKLFSFLGDSITTYAGYPGSQNNFYTGSNAGVTSVEMTWWKRVCNLQGGSVNRIYANGGKDIVNALCLQYNNLFSNGTTGVAPDVIMILGGANDWYHNKTLGTIDDAPASNTSFYAAYKYLLDGLKTIYPNATIIGLTILNTMYLGTTVPYLNAGGKSIVDFCDAIKKCCDYYSVNCIDLNKLVNINGGNYTSILADYTHPNNAGFVIMSEKINKQLMYL